MGSDLMLTKHEQFHIDAIIRDARECKVKSTDVRKLEAASKTIKDEDYDSYLDKVEVDASAISASGIFPSKFKDSPSDIHDYLEHNVFTGTLEK
jgi:hypothetical protein